jgi:hypothetical protein
VTTPAGTITFGDVNTELGRSSTATLGLNEGSATVSGPRFLAAIFSGTISMNALRSQTLFARTGGTTLASGGCFIEEDQFDCIATTSSASIGTITGGTASYTYSWAKISGFDFTVNSPTSSSTTFTADINTSQNERTAVYKCTATDSLGRQVFGPNCDVVVNQF